MRTNFFYSTLLSLAFLSCATPKKINTWVASSNKTFFVQGIEYQSSMQDSIYAICGVAEIERNQLMLDLEITNKKENPILFNPRSVYYEFKAGDQIETVYAFDPEVEILRSKVRESELEANQKNAAALGATLFILGTATAIVSDVAANNAKTEKGYNTAVAANLTGNVGMEVGGALLQNSMYQSVVKIQSGNERVYWKQHTYRKSHIPTNESMRGTVVLPIYDVQSLIRLRIPIDTNILEFNFDQKQYSRKELMEMERGH